MSKISNGAVIENTLRRLADDAEQRGLAEIAENLRAMRNFLLNRPGGGYAAAMMVADIRVAMNPSVLEGIAGGSLSIQEFVQAAITEEKERAAA